MSSLNGDVMSEILGRVYGITLASAGCVSSQFRSIARQESMWEGACSNLWPSTTHTDVKQLISYSLGGFRNFYANCFPSIVYESSEKDFKYSCDDSLELHTCDPSDFVSLVDVLYMDKVVYTKILWGIPHASNVKDLFCNHPFIIDIIEFWDFENEDPTILDGFPTVVSLDREMGKEKFWEHLMENFKLSWIVINRRTGEAANLSSWRPLFGQRFSDADFVMRFGSILPSQNKDVECVISITIRVPDNNDGSLKIAELNMRLEDTMGVRVNGRKSLVTLERALSCKKSRDHHQLLQLYEKYSRQRRIARERNTRNEGVIGTLSTLSAIISFVSFFLLIFRLLVLLVCVSWFVLSELII